MFLQQAQRTLSLRSRPLLGARPPQQQHQAPFRGGLDGRALGDRKQLRSNLRVDRTSTHVGRVDQPAVQEDESYGEEEDEPGEDEDDVGCCMCLFYLCSLLLSSMLDICWLRCCAPCPLLSGVHGGARMQDDGLLSRLVVQVITTHEVPNYRR